MVPGASPEVEEAEEACGDLAQEDPLSSRHMERDFMSRMNRIGQMAFGPLLEQSRRPKQSKPETSSRGLEEDVDPSLLPEEESLVRDTRLRLLDDTAPDTEISLPSSSNLSDDEKERTLMKILQLDHVIETEASGCAIDTQTRTDSEQETVDLSLPIDNETNIELVEDEQREALATKEDPDQTLPSEGIYSGTPSLEYGPPSNTSAPPASLPSAPASLARGSEVLSEQSEEETKTQVNFCPIEQELVSEGQQLPEGLHQAFSNNCHVLPEGWRQYELPGVGDSIWETAERLWFCDSEDNVFYSGLQDLPDRLEWKKAGVCLEVTPCSASQISLPPWWCPLPVEEWCGGSTSTRPTASCRTARGPRYVKTWPASAWPPHPAGWSS